MLNNNLLMISYIRGYIISNNLPYDNNILKKDLFQLSSNEIDALINYGKKNNLKLYYFKDKELLPRVKTVLGFLKNIYPQTILDVGSGRGAFLFPLLIEFENIQVTSLEILEKRIKLLENISIGGVKNLEVKSLDITKYNYDNNLYDCVTLLEVLEHIPNVTEAIKNAIYLTKKYIIITVPNKEDDNPEHIHLLTEKKLTEIFNTFNITNLKFKNLNNHLLLIATK